MKKFPRKALHCKRSVVGRLYDDRSKYSGTGRDRGRMDPRPVKIFVNKPR